MKEKEESQIPKFRLPPVWCSSLCRNAMNQICVESCAIKRDCSSLDAKPNLKLEDMPSFPLSSSAEMTKEEKFTVITVYLAKVVDHLNGNEEETKQTVYPRPRTQVLNRKKVVNEVSKLLLSSEGSLEDKAKE